MEIFRSVQFFYASGNVDKIDYLVLCGEASVAGLDEAVANRTEIDTVIANPFISMEKSSRIRENVLNDVSPSLLIATGLSFGRVYG